MHTSVISHKAVVHSFFQVGLTPVKVKMEGKTLQITASETMVVQTDKEKVFCNFTQGSYAYVEGAILFLRRLSCTPHDLINISSGIDHDQYS